MVCSTLSSTVAWTILIADLEFETPEKEALSCNCIINALLFSKLLT